MKIEGWVGIVNLKLKLTDIKTGSSGHLAWKNDMSVIGVSPRQLIEPDIPESRTR